MVITHSLPTARIHGLPPPGFSIARYHGKMAYLTWYKYRQHAEGVDLIWYSSPEHDDAGISVSGRKNRNSCRGWDTCEG